MANANPGNSFFADLMHTLRSWLHVDRVRIAGNEGRSLKIRISDRIMIRNRCFIVQNRTVTDDLNDSQCTRIIYQIRDDESDDVNAPSDTLEVFVPKDGTTVQQLSLKRGPVETQIDEQDITVL
ncbi:MAG: hypothetical protein O2856_20045 [Planctomycetota bacterium]|nr:hypothetical protein [Planctomycetota bacterium]